MLDTCKWECTINEICQVHFLAQVALVTPALSVIRYGGNCAMSNKSHLLIFLLFLVKETSGILFFGQSFRKPAQKRRQGKFI